MNYWDIIDNDFANIGKPTLQSIFDYLKPYWEEVRLVDQRTAFILRQIHAIIIKKVFAYRNEDEAGKLGKVHIHYLNDNDLEIINKAAAKAGLIFGEGKTVNILNAVHWMEHLRDRLIRRYIYG